MSDKRKYRTFTANQKVELVLAPFRGDRSIPEICREHDLPETLLRRWRDQMVEAGAERYQDARWWRVAQISRRAIYRVPKTRPPAANRSATAADDVEAAIVEVAEDNQTYGYRMVCAPVAHKLGRAVNRKRVLRVMRAPAHPASPAAGSFGRYRLLHARDRRLASGDALSREGGHYVVEHSAATGAITPRTLTLGTDNGSAFTARVQARSQWPADRASRRRLPRPQSPAFIECWFSKLKERCVWLHEFETLEAREVIAAYIARYHHRPHSGFELQNPAEVARTWDPAFGDPQTHAA